MSYEKNTWTTGDIITAEKLNNIEEGISGAKGYLVESEEVVILPETEITFDYDSGIAAYVGNTSCNFSFEKIPEEIRIVPIMEEAESFQLISLREKGEGYVYYGDSDNLDEENPVSVEIEEADIYIYLFIGEVSGDVPAEQITFKIEGTATNIDLEEDFQTAVNSIVKQGYISPLFIINISRQNSEYVADKTYNEILEAFTKYGLLPVVYYNHYFYYLLNFNFGDTFNFAPIARKYLFEINSSNEIFFTSEEEVAN